MNKDNFIKNCHRLAEDAELIMQGKDGTLYVPSRFWTDISSVLAELGTTTKCPYYTKDLDKEQEHERSRDI